MKVTITQTITGTDASPATATPGFRNDGFPGTIAGEAQSMRLSGIPSMHIAIPCGLRADATEKSKRHPDARSKTQRQPLSIALPANLETGCFADANVDLFGTGMFLAGRKLSCRIKPGIDSLRRLR